MRFLVFSVSLRTESLNTHPAKLAATTIEKHGGKVDYANMSEFDCPSYNGDDEKINGVPNGAAEFQKRLLANDAFIISSPEYNGSMPGLIKNRVMQITKVLPKAGQTNISSSAYRYQLHPGLTCFAGSISIYSASVILFIFDCRAGYYKISRLRQYLNVAGSFLLLCRVIFCMGLK